MYNIRIYISLPVFALPLETPLFFNLWLAAKRTLSRMEVTVRTPPTMAHVLQECGSVVNGETEEQDIYEMNARCQEVSEGLSGLFVDDLDRRDLVVEEGT